MQTANPRKTKLKTIKTDSKQCKQAANYEEFNQNNYQVKCKLCKLKTIIKSKQI